MMVKFMMATALAAAAPSVVAAQGSGAPLQPNGLLVVEATQGRGTMIMLGFIAYGGEDDLARLGAAAGRAGLRSDRLVREDAVTEQMTLFPPGSDRADALRLYRRARSGDFGTLRIEVVVVPLAAAADGIDMATEVQAQPPDFLADPER